MSASDLQEANESAGDIDLGLRNVCPCDKSLAAVAAAWVAATITCLSSLDLSSFE